MEWNCYWIAIFWW